MPDEWPKSKRESTLGYREYDDNTTRAAQACERFARACLRDNKAAGNWLTLSGPTGTGKTHLALAVTHFVGSRQISAFRDGLLPCPSGDLPLPLWLSWPRTASCDMREFADVLDREIMPSRLLVLDDVGAETDQYKSGEPSLRLREVLEMAKSKWLMITTNVPPRLYGQKWDARIADRLLGGITVTMEGTPSYRIQ